MGVSRLAGHWKGYNPMFAIEYSMYLQIRSRLSDLKQESGQLQQVWLNQKQHLDQMLQLQFFLRDAKNIDAMSGAHEVSYYFTLYLLRVREKKFVE